MEVHCTFKMLATIRQLRRAHTHTHAHTRWGRIIEFTILTTVVTMAGIADPKDLGINKYEIQIFSNLREYFHKSYEHMMEMFRKIRNDMICYKDKWEFQEWTMVSIYFYYNT